MGCVTDYAGVDILPVISLAHTFSFEQVSPSPAVSTLPSTAFSSSEYTFALIALRKENFFLTLTVKCSLSDNIAPKQLHITIQIMIDQCFQVLAMFNMCVVAETAGNANKQVFHSETATNRIEKSLAA